MKGMPPADGPSERLVGGNMNQVVRIGTTVRRSTGPWTPTVHALLEHLAAAGFDAGPRVLGRDDLDREILSYLPGTVPGYPLPDWVFADATLIEVVQLLHRYHDATATFVPPPGSVWQLPTHRPDEVICHNDFAPYNLVFDDDHRLTGVIDFDTASPGSRVWDLAYVAYRFVPLVHPDNRDGRNLDLGDLRRRLALLCSAYGADHATAREVATVAVQRLDELAAFIVAQATAGDPAHIAVRARGDDELYRRDCTWLAQTLPWLV